MPPSRNQNEQPATQTESYAALNPALHIDWEGNPNEQELSRTEPQPMDWAKVKINKNKWQKRPELSQSMNQKVSDNLEKFVEETMKQPESHGTKAQKEMSEEDRDYYIERMFHKSARIVGIAPLSSEHISKVEANLVKKGVLKKSENPSIRRQRTIKSLVKSWAMKNLDMTDRDWSSIQIEELMVTDNSDIIFIRCKTYEDAARITANAKYLPNDNGPESPQIIMHVDIRAKKRHKAFLNIAKSIRELSNNTIQTSVRAGRKDFPLRQHPRGSNTPWAQIPPNRISQELPGIEIGTYKDIINPSNRMEEEEMEIPMSDQELKQVSEDIEDQYKETEKTENEKNKQDRTQEENLSRIKRQKKTLDRSKSLSSSGPSSSSSSGSESGSESASDSDPEESIKLNKKIKPKKIHNSTLNDKIKDDNPDKIVKTTSIPQKPENTKWITHYNSLPATPYPRLKVTGNNILDTVLETPAPKNLEQKPAHQNIPETPDQAGDKLVDQKVLTDNLEELIDDPATGHNSAVLHKQDSEDLNEQFYEPVTNLSRLPKDLDLPLSGKDKNGKNKKNPKNNKNTKTNHE